MPKPICMTCKKFYRPMTDGITIEEGRPVSKRNYSQEFATYRDDTTWLPYKLWRGDLMECKSCGHQIVSGYGVVPLSEHYEKDYDEIKKGENVIAFIEDC